MARNPWSRRKFLQIMGLAGGAVGFRAGVLPNLARASSSDQLLLCVYFGGGHDQLLCWDPRDNTKYTQNGGTNIYPWYDGCVDGYTRSVLAGASTGGTDSQLYAGTQYGGQQTGVLTSGNLTFGPAVPPSFLQHAPDLCLIRGMTMETLTHQVGMRYWITGKFPRGLQASGSSMATQVAYQESSQADLPNLAISTETYNEGLPAFASGISVSFATDMLNVLQQLGLPLSTASETLLQQFQDSSYAQSCTQHEMNGQGMVDMFHQSQVKARAMVNPQVAGYFKFTVPPSPSNTDVVNLFNALQITRSSDLTGPKGKAAIAGMALAKGVSTAVSVQIQSNLDDHFEWDLHQATTQVQGLDALGLLIGYLKSQPYQGSTSGDTVWNHTTMLVFSEFSRTAQINSRNGRDHHLTSSCVVAGPGLKKNLVIGASSDQDQTFQPIDLTTGQVVPASDTTGWVVRPPDVHATLFQSMGLSYQHLFNQTPQVISALLK